jgi:hypothetical protein
MDYGSDEELRGFQGKPQLVKPVYDIGSWFTRIINEDKQGQRYVVKTGTESDPL